MDKIKIDQNVDEYLEEKKAREVLEQLSFDELLERHLEKAKDFDLRILASFCLGAMAGALLFLLILSSMIF